MIDEHYIELMNDEIDGRNTPAQSGALRSYLESDPEAQRFFAELEKPTGLLAESKAVAPPVDMSQQIMDLIAESDARQQVSRAGSTPEARPASGARPETGERARRRRFGSFLQPAPAWAFAAGLALGLLAFTAFDVLHNGAPSPEQLRGDMAVTARGGDELLGSPWRSEGSDFTGTITAHRGEGRLVLHFVGIAGPDTRFLLAHDKERSGVVFHGLAGSATTLTTLPGRTTLAFAGAGDHIVALVGDDLAGAVLTLRIESMTDRREHVFGPGPP